MRAIFRVFLALALLSPVAHAAGPFNRCTNVAVLASGAFWVADGYGNARVHRFAADGTAFVAEKEGRVKIFDGLADSAELETG